jgi:ATP-binding cassette subfamily F protein 3
MAEAAAAVDPELAGETLADLHHRFDEIGGYAARARAATLLAGLGFPVARHGEPVTSFSGGWRMRLNLGRALMCRSDLLLLDEPTNHLDLTTIEWLEGTGSFATPARCFSSRTTAISWTASQRRSSMSTRRSSRPIRAIIRSSSASGCCSSRCNRPLTRCSNGRSRTCNPSSMLSCEATKAKQAQSRIKALERMERTRQRMSTARSSSRSPVEAATKQLVRLEDATWLQRRRPS